MPARLAGGVLVAALLAGCATGQPSAQTREPAAGEAAPAAPACERLPEQAPAVGSDGLPALTLPCLGPGPDVWLDRLTGRPTLVNLWATWCGPCREEMPLLQAAHGRHGEQIRFLGVDVQDDPRPPAGSSTSWGSAIRTRSTLTGRCCARSGPADCRSPSSSTPTAGSSIGRWVS